MKLSKLLLFLSIVLTCLSACNTSNGSFMGRSNRSRSSAPSGKYRNPTIFSRVNPFQGRAKARLAKSKRKKAKLFKRRRKQRGRYRKSPKPGRTFNMKRSLSRGRLKSSGSRTKSGGGKQKKNKNLFNTRK